MLTNVQIIPIRVIPMPIVIIPSDLITALVTLDFLEVDKIALVSFLSSFTKRAAFVQWCLAGIMSKCSRLFIATISGRRNRSLKIDFQIKPCYKFLYLHVVVFFSGRRYLRVASR